MIDADKYEVWEECKNCRTQGWHSVFQDSGSSMGVYNKTCEVCKGVGYILKETVWLKRIHGHIPGGPFY